MESHSKSASPAATAALAALLDDGDTKDESERSLVAPKGGVWLMSSSKPSSSCGLKRRSFAHHDTNGSSANGRKIEYDADMYIETQATKKFRTGDNVSSLFDRLKEDVETSLFPSITWPIEEDLDNDDDHPILIEAHHPSYARIEDHDSSEDEGDHEGDRERHYCQPSSTPMLPTLKRVPRFQDKLSLLPACKTFDLVSQMLYEGCPVIPEEYQVLSEYSQPITLALFFRLYQSYTTAFAYQWCAGIAVVHTIYSFVTDFTASGAATRKGQSPWTLLNFLWHQVVDSISLHALITTMLLYPEWFGSHAFGLAVLLIQTQPIHLSMWFKSNFKTCCENETKQIPYTAVIRFAIPSILLLSSRQFNRNSRWEAFASMFCYYSGIIALNLAPVSILKSAYYQLEVLRINSK